jgi:hypothetical protein
MRKHTQIQSFFWKIANYNPFFMKFCDSSFNNVAGIGLIFLMQISVAFFSGYVTATLFNLSWIFSGLIGLLFILILLFYIKQSTMFLKEDFDKNRVSLLFLGSIIISLIIALPFLLKIFQIQIEYVYLLNEGEINLTNTNKIWKLPYGLFNACFNKDNGLTVFIIILCFYLLMLSIFFYPYSLIFKNRNTLYHKIRKLYEKRFIQE